MQRFNTLINEDRLHIISDLHLGHPSFAQRDKLNSFLTYLSNKNTSLCINGDGIDLLQLSVPKVLDEIPSLWNGLQTFLAQGSNRIYYVVGNHDIYMESYLEHSGILNVVPFLEVLSGDQRIHIEHGYLYDFSHIYFHAMMTQLTKVVGLFLKPSPALYHLYGKLNQLMFTLWNRIKTKQGSVPFDRPNLVAAAREILERGFDTVIFGHSHYAGMEDFGDNRKYANAGSWLADRIHYIEIDKGEIRLKEWK
jgi:UDP-2,3-diacylglucosamine pyrophosphatase LpxH